MILATGSDTSALGRGGDLSLLLEDRQMTFSTYTSSVSPVRNVRQDQGDILFAPIGFARGGSEAIGFMQAGRIDIA